MLVVRGLLAIALLPALLNVLPAQESTARDSKPAANAAPPPAADDLREELRPGLEAFVQSFNAGKATEVAAAFLDDGEFVTEAGEVHSGRAAVETLMTQYFTDFPKAQLTVDVETIRRLAPDLLIEEGTREVAVADSEIPPVRIRYIAVRAKRDNQWKIAALREFADDPEPTPGEHLQDLAWLEGEWVNEGTDATIQLNFHWSDDGNFLLGEYETFVGGESQGKATQRFGWDPVCQQIRSWLFEPDGAYSEATWAPNAEGWTCKSNTVLPDGTTGSATVRILAKGPDQFVLRGNDRVIAGEPNEDYEVQIVRKPAVQTSSETK